MGLIQDINENEDDANQESRAEDFSDRENDDQVDDLGVFKTFDEETCNKYAASEVKSKRSNATSQRTSGSKRLGSARRRTAYMADADMFETKS